jgi:hypothetical protein
MRVRRVLGVGFSPYTLFVTASFFTVGERDPRIPPNPHPAPPAYPPSNFPERRRQPAQRLRVALPGACRRRLWAQSDTVRPRVPCISGTGTHIERAGFLGTIDRR